MRNSLLLAMASIIIAGCPEAGTLEQGTTLPDDCVLEYAIALVDVAPSEQWVCQSATNALAGSTEKMDDFHREVWASPSEDLLEDCGDDADVRVSLLNDDTLFEIRCILACVGHTPEAC